MDLQRAEVLNRKRKCNLNINGKGRKKQREGAILREVNTAINPLRDIKVRKALPGSGLRTQSFC